MPRGSDHPQFLYIENIHSIYVSGPGAVVMAYDFRSTGHGVTGKNITPAQTMPGIKVG